MNLLPARRLRALLVWGLAAGLALVLTLGTLAALMLQPQPAVVAAETILPSDVERALQLARAHDPRRAIPGVVRTLRLSQHELELLLHHASARFANGRWQVELAASRLRLQASFAMPANPLGRWLNIALVAHESAALPQLDAVRVGRVELPVGLVHWAIERAAAHYGVNAQLALTVVQVQHVRLGSGRFEASYAWGNDAPARVVAALLPAQEHERLRVYATHLAQLTATVPPGALLPLSQLLPPMFELARKRSAEGANAALENRAAMLVLGMVANGIGLGTLLPERRQELVARPIRLTLAGRRDFPQHFLTSATIAAENGAPLADMIGLYKELSDARSGSGFSFNDIAANRAGTRFGELAVAAPGELQQRLIAGLQEHDFMPDVSDLPEFLGNREFRRRFGGPGSPEFERMVADIEDRLAATPLFR